MHNEIRVDLDILGTHWSVDVGDLPSNVLGQKRFGFMDATAQEIKINHDVHASWRVYLLLHEMLHALIFMGHLQFLKRDDIPMLDDEAKLDAIASLFSEVLTRNKFFNTAVFDVEPFEAGRVRNPGQEQRVKLTASYPSASAPAAAIKNGQAGTAAVAPRRREKKGMRNV